MSIIAEWFGSLASVFWIYLVKMAIKFAEFLAIATLGLIRHVSGELAKLANVAH